ncbi:MAG: substrate-binding domain-containing protein [Anaerolineae bacterium]|nr:substrate-binding domain-containing protein [Anaerolineae bacterium]
MRVIQERGGLTTMLSHVVSQQLHFTFISTYIDEDFFIPARKGMQGAADMLEVVCTFIGTPEADIPAQVAMVHNAIDAKVDGIALNN